MLNKNQSVTRIKKILHSDKNALPLRMNDVLQSELFGLLHNYLDVNKEDINVVLEINNDGVYELNVNLKAAHIKTFYQI